MLLCVVCASVRAQVVGVRVVRCVWREWSPGSCVGPRSASGIYMKQQTTPAAPRDALECVAALARTREDRQNCVRFAYLGPQVDRLHVLELNRDVE